MFSCLNESIAASAENSWFNSRFQCKRSRQEIALSLARTPFWRGTRRSVESIVKLRERFSLNAKQRARRPSVGQKPIPNGISSYLPMNNSYHSVDVVLLPVQRGVGLDDDVLMRGLLEFVDEHGLAGLQSFGDFRIHTDREVGAFVIGRGHLARFGLDFVAERGDRLDHAGAGAIRAGLAENALERLLSALAGDTDEAELVEGECF